MRGADVVILVTNDDGVHSPGLIALYKAMKEVGNAYIVAPDRERSAVGHSLTLHRPLKVEEVREHVYSVNGTPTDAVVLGVNKILPRKPDIVVSGINRGGNLGDDITYSGTVSAAIEGTILNVPSLAVSVHGERNCHFDTAAIYALRVVRHIIENPLPYDTFLNVNVPNMGKGDVRGIRITRQGKRIYDNSIQDVFSPRGERHYWIGGGIPYWEHGDDTDISAVEKGYVSVTPVHLDLTNYSALQLMKKQIPSLFGEDREEQEGAEE
ncbi:MAG TPA: 5'/3'-nucleotidase SurE [Thermodesulfovibrionales bacterium]|nr:5'/3'-nucleotidase SurE [Thermodesulfovibrionales bacterium]